MEYRVIHHNDGITTQRSALFNTKKLQYKQRRIPKNLASVFMSTFREQPTFHLWISSASCPAAFVTLALHIKASTSKQLHGLNCTDVMLRCDQDSRTKPALVTYPDQTFTNKLLGLDPMLKNTHLLTKFLRFVRLVLVMPNTDFQLSQHLSFRNTTSARETHFSFADEPNTPISSDWKEAPTFSLQQLLAPNRGSRYLPPTGGIFFPRWAQIRGKHW